VRLAALDETADVVINCVGYTGRPNIDACEDDPAATWTANYDVPCQLARSSRRLIHISSGCIFDGAGPFTETDEPNCVSSVYTQSKRAAENALRHLPRVSLLRIRMPLAPEPHERNLITKVRAYSRVIDAQNSVTWLPDLADVVKMFVSRADLGGIWNVVNRGTVSPWELSPAAERLTSLGGVTRVPRSNCRLSVAKLEAARGAPMPDIRERLRSHGFIA
jgi:dTDP-4-dehydrorhamnose reductase